MEAKNIKGGVNSLVISSDIKEQILEPEDNLPHFTQEQKGLKDKKVISFPSLPYIIKMLKQYFNMDDLYYRPIFCFSLSPDGWMLGSLEYK